MPASCMKARQSSTSRARIFAPTPYTASTASSPADKLTRPSTPPPHPGWLRTQGVQQAPNFGRLISAPALPLTPPGPRILSARGYAPGCGMPVYTVQEGAGGSTVPGGAAAAGGAPGCPGGGAMCGGGYPYPGGGCPATGGGTYGGGTPYCGGAPYGGGAAPAGGGAVGGAGPGLPVAAAGGRPCSRRWISATAAPTTRSLSSSCEVVPVRVMVGPDGCATQQGPGKALALRQLITAGMQDESPTWLRVCRICRCMPMGAYRGGRAPWLNVQVQGLLLAVGRHPRGVIAPPCHDDGARARLDIVLHVALREVHAQVGGGIVDDHLLSVVQRAPSGGCRGWRGGPRDLGLGRVKQGTEEWVVSAPSAGGDSGTGLRRTTLQSGAEML